MYRALSSRSVTRATHVIALASSSAALLWVGSLPAAQVDAVHVPRAEQARALPDSPARQR